MTIDDLTFPATRRELTRAAIVSAIETMPAKSPRRRTSTIVAVAVAALAIPAGAAGAYYAFREVKVEDTSTIRCFTDATLDGAATYLDSGANVDPVKACGDLWSQGILRAGMHEAQEPTPGADFPVPRLATCVIDYFEDQVVVAVIPGDDTVCEQLGLPRWAQ